VNLRCHLRAAGAHVWLDQLEIKPGQRWDRAEEDALASRPVFLVVLSPASVNSTNVMDEVSLGLRKHHEAIAKYKKSVDLDPNNAVVCNNWGSALKELGRNSEAERKFSKYRELH